MSNVAASSSPLIVIFLPPVMSIFESVTIALLAITVPAVIPSIVSSSASFITALPIVKPAAVTTPVTASVSPIVANPETVKSSVVVSCSAWTVPEATTLPVTA